MILKVRKSVLKKFVFTKFNFLNLVKIFDFLAISKFLIFFLLILFLFF